MSIDNQDDPIDIVFLLDFKSKDDTRAIYTSFEGNFEKRLLFFDYAPGPLQSFVLGLSLVGDFMNPSDVLFVCDQDDVWKQKKVKVVMGCYKGLLDNKAKFICIHHRVDLYKEDLALGKNLIEMDSNLISSKYVTGYFSVMIGHTCMFNKDGVEYLKMNSGLEFEKLSLMHDWGWSILMDNIDGRYFIDESLSFYRLHDKQLVGKNKSSNFTSLFSLQRKIRYMRKGLSTNRRFKDRVIFFLELLKWGTFKQILIGMLRLIY